MEHFEFRIFGKERSLRLDICVVSWRNLGFRTKIRITGPIEIDGFIFTILSLFVHYEKLK